MPEAIYELFTQYDTMTKDEILTHLQDWFFGINPQDEFNQARESKQLVLIDGKYELVTATATASEKSTVDGKEGVWRTIRGTPVFIPDGEDFDEVISKRFKSPVKPSRKSEQEKQTVDFPEARKKHQEFQQSAKSQSYSYDPVTGKGFDAFNQDDAKQMYDRYGNGSDPVYFISETNHAGQLSRESESAYINIQNRGKDPIIGRWVSDETGFDYTDVSYAEATNDENSIVEVLRKTNQESALKLNPDGTVDFVNA